ncbi:MAG TPA: hypothetical protein VFK80_07825, partial [Limnochordia bacterium]|nr:hypothetical protein [Limnochordia bacterium]
APENVLFDDETAEVRFLDLGMAAIAPAASEFMYFNWRSFGGRFEDVLRAYWHAAGGVGDLAALLLRQAYWYGSYYTDCLTWGLEKADLDDEAERAARRECARCILWAARRLRELRAGRCR